MNILSTARKGYQSKKGPGVSSITGGAYGGGYGLGNRLYGYGAEGLDYNKEAGARWDSSIVYPLLLLLADTLGSVPIQCGWIKENASGGQITSADVDAISDHPITMLLEKPNPWYSGALLETAAIFEESSRGNSYAYKHRSAGGKVIAIEQLPEGSCFPYTIPGSGEWISYYAIFTATGYTREKPENVLHMRWSTPNPFWLQIGMSPLEACLPDLVADKLAARHEAVLLKNGAVSSLMAAPGRAPIKDPQSGDAVFELTDIQADQIQRRIDSRLTGDSKGSTFVWPVPMQWEQLGFDPTQLALTDTRHFAESRICACFNIPPAIAGLLVGLEKANNRASYAGAVDQFFDGCAIPYMRHRGRQLTEDLVPELGEEGQAVVYNEAAIPALKARLVRELIDRSGGPLITINEGRTEIGLAPVKGGDVIRSPKGSGSVTTSPSSEDPRKTEGDTTEDMTEEAPEDGL